MTHAQALGQSRSARGGRWGAALALLAAFLVSSALIQRNVAAQTSGLPADLALLPPDAVMVGQLRFAQLWNGELGKSLRQHSGKMLKELMQEMEKKAGLTPQDIDRVTLALKLPSGIMGEPKPIVILTTTKAYSRDKILQGLAPNAKEVKHKGKGFFMSEKAEAGSEPAIAFVGDRMILLAEPAEMRAALDQPPGAVAKGPLGAALLKLAASKQALSAVTHIAPLLQQIPQDLPPEAEPFKPLFKAQFLTQSLDLDKSIRLEVGLQFARADEAQAGAKALNAALEMARGFLGQMGPELEKTVTKEVPELGKALQSALAGLKNLKAVQTGTMVRVALQINVNPVELIASLAPAVEKVRGAAGRMTSANNLKQIALAMHNYESTHGHFPTHAIYSKEGKPLLSWRVAILPFVEEDALYKQFKLDEPWDSPNNKKLLARMPKVYAPPEGRTTKEPYMTYYQVFTGPSAFFGGPKGQRLSQIRDGSSNTLLTVEAGEPVLWTKPEDVVVDPKKPLPKLGGLFPELPTFNVGFADGSVRALNRQIKEYILRALISPRGGEMINPNDF